VQLTCTRNTGLVKKLKLNATLDIYQIKSYLLNNKGLDASYKLLKTFNRHKTNKRYMYTLLIIRDVAFLFIYLFIYLLIKTKTKGSKSLFQVAKT